jgi:hypothetical protein
MREESLNQRKKTNGYSKMIDPCVYCGESTAFGFGKFVNRLPVDDGWGCAECSGFECDGCEKQIYLDSDVTDSNGEGHYHEQCVPEDGKP